MTEGAFLPQRDTSRIPADLSSDDRIRWCQSSHGWSCAGALLKPTLGRSSAAQRRSSRSHIFRAGTQVNPYLITSCCQAGAYLVACRATAGAAKSLDGIHLTRFHLGLVRILYERDGFTAVNVILYDVVGTQISHWLHGICLATYLYFMAFHGFLDCSANIADPDIDSGSLHAMSVSLLSRGVRHATVLTLIPVLVASLTAARRSS